MPDLDQTDPRRNLVELGQLLAHSVAFLNGKIAEIAVEIEKLREPLSESLSVLAEWIEKLPAIEGFLAETNRRLFIDLLEYSWYLDPEIDTNAALRVAELVAEKNEQELNEVLRAHFVVRLAAVQKRLEGRHPKRRSILAEAFLAHREKRYALAIPVFLSQADGVFRDLHGAEFFRMGKCEPVVRGLIEEMRGISGLEETLLSLREIGTVRKFSEVCTPGSLNRHAVLHGIDMNYGTELNSLKAVSLLLFIDSINEDIEGHRQLPPRPQQTAPDSG
jgi:hypothetical protein